MIFAVFVVNFLSKILSVFGLTVSVKTQEAEMQSLISSLRPRKTSRPLIRMGPDSDGGYLIPDDLDGITSVFSPGVSDTAGFEEQCASLGMDVFLADKSVDGPPNPNEKFVFQKKYLGATSNADYMTINEWMAGSIDDQHGDLILQMDIEGYEYEVLLNISPENLNRFRIIIIEFHWLNWLWNRQFYLLASSAIVKLLQTHQCVHAHPNNACYVTNLHGISIPSMIEFTFYRKDRDEMASYSTTFPHPLDRDNAAARSVKLPKVWYVAS